MSPNIIDLIKEQHPVTENTPVPTEKAQIVVLYTSGATNIFRYNTVKKAQKEYDTIWNGWEKYFVKQGPRLRDVDADMFSGIIDFTQLTSVCLVDHAKRNKFIPIQ
jgi:hypothetical protein